MRRSASAIATVSALVASVVLVAPASNAAETITSGGSSYANGIISACAAAYKTDTVTYASTSSGTGRTNFRTGTYDFGASDAAYSATDVKPASFTYVPLVGGPIAIMFNVEGVTSLNLTAKVGHRLYRSTIRQQQVRSLRLLAVSLECLVALHRGYREP